MKWDFILNSIIYVLLFISLITTIINYKSAIKKERKYLKTMREMLEDNLKKDREIYFLNRELFFLKLKIENMKNEGI